MHYIVDGYNLLFRILTSSVDLATRRQTIIENLNKKIQVVGIDVTIVFDSHYRLEEGHKSHYNHLEIQFTSRGVTADDWIIEKVKRLPHPEREIVVTSDKKLAWSVRHSLAKTETIEEFVSSLNRRYKNKLLGEKKQAGSSQKPFLKSVKQVNIEKSTICELKPEECFEFYLKEFEENVSKFAKPEKPPKKIAKLKKHEFQKKQKIEVDHKSDMERWLEIFNIPPEQ